MSGDEEPEPAVVEAPPPAPEPEVAKLRAELEAAAKRAEDLLDRLKRAQADYENLRKRAARETEEARDLANETLLASLLPVLDDFDHALAAAKDDDGLRMIHGNLWGVLSRTGLEAVDPVGRPFDPYEHEVVGRATDEGLSEGTVKEVVQKGYRYRRRLLRAAKVIVATRGE